MAGWLKALAYGAGGMAVVGLAALVALQERLVYVPALPGLARAYSITPSRLRLVYEDVWLRAADGVRLHSWFIRHSPTCRGKHHPPSIPHQPLPLCFVLLVPSPPVQCFDRMSVLLLRQLVNLAEAGLEGFVLIQIAWVDRGVASSPRSGHRSVDLGRIWGVHAENGVIFMYDEEIPSLLPLPA